MSKESKESQHHDVIVVGAGPAGLSTAIQLKRHAVSALVLDSPTKASLLRNAWLVENYPGFPQGVGGPELLGIFREQAKRVGATVRNEELVLLEREGEQFILWTKEQKLSARVVVLATGTRARKPELKFRATGPLKQKLEARVLSGVHLLGKLEGKIVAILGAGDAAFDHALGLAERNNKVIILNRKEKRRCLPLLWERAREQKSIRYLENTSVHTVAAGEGERLQLLGVSEGERLKLEADFLITAIGREPRLNFLSPEIKQELLGLREKGKIYLVGDLGNQRFRQVGIAVGDGLRAAMAIARDLEQDESRRKEEE